MASIATACNSDSVPDAEPAAHALAFARGTETMKLHVLALDITERQHADIQHCRDNVFYLVDYLRAQGIVHVVAHPLYGVNDRLSIEHFEKMLLLFKNFEMNGARNDVANDGLEAVLKALSPDMIEALSDRHGIDPAFPEPWKKNITGGSDDHSALNIARTYTEIHGAESLREGLAGLDLLKDRDVVPHKIHVFGQHGGGVAIDDDAAHIGRPTGGDTHMVLVVEPQLALDVEAQAAGGERFGTFLFVTGGQRLEVGLEGAQIGLFGGSSIA